MPRTRQSREDYSWPPTYGFQQQRLRALERRRVLERANRLAARIVGSALREEQLAEVAVRVGEVHRARGDRGAELALRDVELSLRERGASRLRVRRRVERIDLDDARPREARRGRVAVLVGERGEAPRDLDVRIVGVERGRERLSRTRAIAGGQCEIRKPQMRAQLAGGARHERGRTLEGRARA